MDLLGEILEFFAELLSSADSNKEEKKCCGGGCHAQQTQGDEWAPITPVDYSDESKVRFSREEKKIDRLRSYFKSSESDEN